jgi:purine-binding chemotaxis protein CheW
MARSPSSRKRAPRKKAAALATPEAAGGESAAESSRIALPSSGLAADILALAASGALEAAVGSEAAPLVERRAAAPETEAAVPAHNISLFGAPVREQRKAVEATEHLATFFLSGEEYGIDVRLVQEIIRVGEITQVPRAPGFIKGVINLRGRIIPVIDLKRKLGLGEVSEAARQSRIVVVKVRDRLVGLLVDGASQVLKVPVASIEAAPEEVVEIDANYLRGVAKLENRLIILIDLTKVLALELREGGATD